ncbi:MAG: hypothetical protein K6T83_18530 [Alicyclobacillus sp.]|nr:hypothetical protein [Alicyclobacillus sp.]
MVIVELDRLESGGWSNNNGVFSGQNIQNSWDSHAPTVASFGTFLGDWDHGIVGINWLSIRSYYSQPVFDQDIKANASRLRQA